ncbi:MAG: twin-arginine translocase TatA/TatE family subunit [Rickettsiales bacterium]|jgi:sec-independent protein translocase protein TatA|nr:twin-arginine translocase TatA/TatE family subunit [Rickettsiales bacterium]
MKAGFWEILLIVILILVLFGHAKIPDMMRNLANGLNVFKKEIKKESGKKTDGDKEKSVKSVAKKSAKKVAKPAAKKPVKKK